MKIINYIGFIFLSLLVSTTVLYILGSIGSASTNLKVWSPETRGLISFGILLGTIVLSVFCITSFIEHENGKNKKEY